MIPRTREEKFLHRGSVRRVLCRGSIEEYADPSLVIKHNNDFLNKRKEVSTTRKCGRVLRCRSIEDCANPLLCIKHHNNS